MSLSIYINYMYWFCLGVWLAVFFSKFFTYITRPYGPRHKILNNVVCVTSKASDQPVHGRSRIRAYASRFNILKLLNY